MEVQNCFEAMKTVIMSVGKEMILAYVKKMCYCKFQVVSYRFVSIIFFVWIFCRNDFEQPIIAQWIRINPTRWADRIALRMELYGCRYIPDVLYFNGKAMIQKELVSIV